jgi:GT2 family glycosyltransferase
VSAPLDIIIPAYGGTDLTWRCLMHLWLFAPPGSRIVVVDDCSPDEMPKMGAFLTRSRSAIYHRHAENRGCTNAWNTGIELTKDNPSEFTLFVNNDCCVMPGSIAMLQAVAQQGYPIVCANEVNGPVDEGYDPAKYLPQSNTEKLTLDLGIFKGACFIVKRSHLDAMGGFDGKMSHGFGDTDFLIRGRDAGVGPVMVKEAVVFHGAGVSSKRMGIMKAMSRYRNDLDAFREKWKDRPEVIDEVAFGKLVPSDLTAICEQGWTHGER